MFCWGRFFGNKERHHDIRLKGNKGKVPATSGEGKKETDHSQRIRKKNKNASAPRA